MERTRKIWGERWLLRRDSVSESSVLFLGQGMECSWHRHATKYNLFVVISGLVGIVVEELGEPKETKLAAGECFTTKPGQWHNFRAHTDSVIVEIMYVEYDPGDIERQTIGGRFFHQEGDLKTMASEVVEDVRSHGTFVLGTKERY